MSRREVSSRQTFDTRDTTISFTGGELFRPPKERRRFCRALGEGVAAFVLFVFMLALTL